MGRVGGTGRNGWIALIAGIAMAVAGCSRRPPAPMLASAQFRGANVLLVTIDTLRRDRLGAYGSTAGLTPTLDRLAASGIVYEHAYSHVPMTLPAHTSILTGRVPATHGVHNNTSFRVADNLPTLATTLKGAGYRTGAFVGAFVLDARFGLNRGFDDYDDRYPHSSGTATFRFDERRGSEVVQAAGDWILNQGDQGSGIRDQGSGPWFAWVHLFDPHAPYDAPPEYRAGRAPYDAEVAYADAMLGRLLDRLRAAHALDRTLIVMTADHGESLGEHGETTHGLFAYDATLAVPLIVAGSSIAAGRIDTPVGHDDIMPTILDLAAVAPPAGMDGRSLVAPPPADRGIVFEALDANLTRGWAPLTGIVSDHWKYIDLPIRELYDVQADPRELTNAAERDPAHRDLLARALARMASLPRQTGNPTMLDADAAARLRALGYAGGAALPRKEAYTAADDPKALVALNERFNSALEAFDAGRTTDAFAAFAGILRDRPDFLTARTSAATVLLDAGRPADAVALLRGAPAAQARSAQLLAKLGTALADAGDLSGAASAFEQARAGGDQNPDLVNALGVVYARLGRQADARAMFEEMLRRDPGAAGTWYNLGLLELAASRPQQAADAFRRAVRADPAHGEAWQGLGAALVGTDRSAAVDAWRHAERLRPHDYDLLFNLGMVLAEGDHPADSLPYLRRFAQEAPRGRYGRDLPRVEAAIAKASR
ncbi:MAG TPA: sulfatase-like hydrolase/transferase [Vicinamibacterales bacterium]|nr:sulfatase-like hydrolase/transferase [Vicinamibacterales bacterium]